MAMHHADLIFAVGARFDDRVTNNPDKFCPNAQIIHVDVDPASISKIINADIPIVGDALSVLEELDALVEAELGRTPGAAEAMPARRGGAKSASGATPMGWTM